MNHLPQTVDVNGKFRKYSRHSQMEGDFS